MSSLSRVDLLPESELWSGAELIAEGRALVRDWPLGSCPFLSEHGVVSEADHKRQQAAAGEVMLHAQIGYRDKAKTLAAAADIHDVTARRGRAVARYGICLDWSMGFPTAMRQGRPRGTGLILDGPEDFAALSRAAPVAPHFGDFVLGFPAALENTQAALAAGATAIGNLGQYFTFRLPGWDDEVASTEATLRALGLIAAQPAEVLVHSNLDDGFAALFTDLSCVLGAVLIEQHIVDRLIGARVSHCFGHHFSEPLTRAAFQCALAQVEDTPGTMVYGNTTSYRGGPAENYASLGSYLLVDALGQGRWPSGHALNPVPVSENERIPDIDEVVAAQLYAIRLLEQAEGHAALIDWQAAEQLADRLIAGGQLFKQRVLAGLAEAGVEISDPMELLLALRRLGPRKLEALFGPGRPDADAPRGRWPTVEAPVVEELAAMADACVGHWAAPEIAAVSAAGLRVCVATSDVHEHGKLLLEEVLRRLGAAPLDGGVSADPHRLVAAAVAQQADVLAISTYNGVALSFLQGVKAELAVRGLDIPVLIGGRLNQIPDASNSSLPVDVGDELAAAGAIVCRDMEALLPALLQHVIKEEHLRP